MEELCLSLINIQRSDGKDKGKKKKEQKLQGHYQY